MPRLCRFYSATTPDYWLHAPARLMQAHVTMMGRLQAEEALATVSQVAAGTGSMQEHDQRAYLRDLRRAAASGRREHTVKATAAMLARIGIRVENVPAKDTEGQQGEEVVSDG